MPESFNFESPDFIGWLSATYSFDFDRLREDIPINGSPERSLSRVVIEGAGNRLFLLERFSKEQFNKKHIIARILDILFSRNLDNIHPYIRTRHNIHLPFYKGGHFQLSDFISGTGLQRPGYLSSRQMGESMADFLIGLSTASTNMTAAIDLSVFSIKAYILKLKRDMQENDLDLYHRYRPCFDFLFQGFMDNHDQLPLSFVHGDFHPVNIIWQRHSIRSVIDWEFAGIKPEIYDAANLVGCAGIEDPEGLGMGMVLSFLTALKKSGVIRESGWEWFPEYVLALRFAWLSEWLRKKDEEMLDLEARYMDILIENMEELRSIWFKK